MSTHAEPDLSKDDVYDLLSNARRRFVLSYLRRADGPVTMSDLAEAVAAWENDVTVDDLTDRQRKRVYVSLHQTHLPKLDDASLVRYDQDAGEVQATENIQSINTYLPGEEPSSSYWQLVYAGIAAAGLLLYGTSILTGTAILGLSGTLIGVGVAVLVTATALVQYVLEQA